MWKLIGLIAIIAVVILLLVANHYHVFHRPKVVEEVIGPMKIIYTTHIGSYHEAFHHCSPILDKAVGAPEGSCCMGKTKFLGIFYDNPQMVPKEQCRSVIGRVVDDDFELKNDVDEKVKVAKIEPGKSIVIHYPFNSMLSIIVAVMKCYPALIKYYGKHLKYPDDYPQSFIELYNYVPQKASFIGTIGKREGILLNFPQ